jgi:hypothetical protein
MSENNDSSQNNANEKETSHSYNGPLLFQSCLQGHQPQALHESVEPQSNEYIENLRFIWSLEE